MKTVVGYLIVILLFAGLVLPLKSDKVEHFKYKFDYKMPTIEKNYLDSSTHTLDSLVEFSEKNLKYLEHEIKRFKARDTITNIRTPLF